MHIPDGLIGANPFVEHAHEAHLLEHAHESNLLENVSSTVNNAIIPAQYQLLIYAIISIILIAFIFNKYRKTHTEKDIPTLALFVVAVVIVQLIELPLPVAACVHVSLITVLALYDLEMSVLVYTFVTIIQAFLGEGGITTLGVNLLNLAIIAPIFAYVTYNLLNKFNKNIALFVSAFLTITVLGIIVSFEYAFAGTFDLMYGLTVIAPIEAIVGILEAIVTIFVMNALKKVKPELVPEMND